MTIETPPNPAEVAGPLTTGQAGQSQSRLSRRINYWFENHWLLTFNTGWGIFVTLPWLAPIFMALNLPALSRAVYFIYNFFCHQLPERSWFLFGPQFSYGQLQIAEGLNVTLLDISNELVRRQIIGTPALGWKVAWSDRMVSMYTSIFLFGLLYALLRQWGFRFKPIAWWVFLLFVVPMALDGTTHLINDALRLDFRQTNTWAMVLTGNIFPTWFYIDDMFGSLNSMLRLVTGVLFGFGVVAFMWPLMDDEFSPRR